ncbi:MAG: hypothetical protein ABJA78_06365 [Ferruginibacter sp.]
MKIKMIILFTFCFAAIGYSQSMPDSLKSKYDKAKTDEEKGKLLYANIIRPSAADSATIVHAMGLINYFKKQHNETGADYMELYVAAALTFKGDYSTSLNMAFPVLSRFEERNDRYGMMHAYHDIGMAYDQAKDREKSFAYSKKSIALAETVDPKGFLSTVCNDLAVSYSTAGLPDSGLLYAQKAVAIDMQARDTFRLSTSMSTVGENYMAAGQYDIALPFLRKSFNYQLIAMGDEQNYSLAYAYNDFAQAFLGLKQYDSVTNYALRSIQVSRLLGYKDQQLRSYEYLYKSFAQINAKDSLNKYLLLAMSAKDSLYSMEKTRSIEAMNFREQIRQQESETEKIKAEEQRRENIQYAFIAFGIITLLIVFLLLSRSFITNTKMIEFLGIIALLIIFEFLNLLLHPFLERVTHHSPVLMLLGLVCIAALLVPLHHRIEKWATAKLVEKNKKIRLAAAKKTIEQLEGN